MAYPPNGSAKDVKSIKALMDPQTIRAYDRHWKEYDTKTRVFWELFPTAFLGRFAALANGKVLDLGSGPGRDGLLLKAQGVGVVCLDASAIMVGVCRKRGLEALVGDFSRLPFPDHSFEGVWAYTSLLHIPRSEIGIPLGEIRRVLGPQGVLGLGMIEGEGEGYGTKSGFPEPRWFSYYQKGEIESLLEEAGFEILHFETFLPGAKSYLNFIARKKK